MLFNIGQSIVQILRVVSITVVAKPVDRNLRKFDRYGVPFSKDETRHFMIGLMFGRVHGVVNASAGQASYFSQAFSLHQR